MCGIVGYVGKQDAWPIIYEGLKRLEYRGYDSAGIAIVDAHGDIQARNHRTPPRFSWPGAHPLGHPRPTIP